MLNRFKRDVSINSKILIFITSVSVSFGSNVNRVVSRFLVFIN